MKSKVGYNWYQSIGITSAYISIEKLVYAYVVLQDCLIESSTIRSYYKGFLFHVNTMLRIKSGLQTYLKNQRHTGQIVDQRSIKRFNHIGVCIEY